MGAEISSAVSQTFWRRRLSNLRRRRLSSSFAVRTVTEADQHPHVRLEDLPGIRLEDVPPRLELESSDGLEAPQVSPSPGGDSRSGKVSCQNGARRADTNYLKPTSPILSLDGRDVVLSEDVKTYGELFQLLKYDLLDLALKTRQNMYDRALNINLYPNRRFSKMLLIVSAVLFLFGSSLGGVVIVLAALFWRERLDE
ncbi:hypothetical protein [Rhodopseudomonas sp. B29]|uniref:hypothetical protein n=1 Tax=Rhodopseudomonas sp. B29 TaxID=95607 RepID=UPI0011D214FF|nr:hypothetical protein [Rhodopseudomonas sp. B29]